jgi:hypothetical protein
VSTSTSPHPSSSPFLVVDFAGSMEPHSADSAQAGQRCQHAARPDRSSIGRERLVVCKRIFGGWGPRI